MIDFIHSDKFNDEDQAKNLAFADQLIEDINKAQYEIQMLQKVATYRKQLAIAKVDEWLAESSKTLQESLDSNLALLKPIVLKHLEGKKTRSLKLPSGRVGFTKGSLLFSIVDHGSFAPTDKLDGKSPRLLEIIKAHGLQDFIITKEVSYADWQKFKQSLSVTEEGKVVTAEGEVLPELSASREPDMFYVKAN